MGLTSWGEEWGDEPRKRRGPNPNAEPRELNDSEREEQRQREKNEHYWARPRDVGSARFTSSGPRLAQGQELIEHAASAAVAKLGRGTPALLICGPCRGGRHGDCNGVFRIGEEDVLCECSDDAHWIQGGGR